MEYYDLKDVHMSYHVHILEFFMWVLLAVGVFILGRQNMKFDVHAVMKNNVEEAKK